jgi:hypothetical protein
MAVTGLKLRDIASGDERWLSESIQRDDIESRGSRDLLPGYSWTADSKAIVLAHHGKIWSLDVATGKETQIPFTADVDQMIGELVRFTYPVNDSVLTVRQIRGARPSPDGKATGVLRARSPVDDGPSGGHTQACDNIHRRRTRTGVVARWQVHRVCVVDRRRW